MLRLLFLIGVCPKESWPMFKNALQGTGLLNRTTGNIGRVERRKLAWPSSMTSMETVGHNFPFFQPPTGGLNPRFEAKNISSLGYANGKLTINWKMNEMLPGIKWHDVACHHEKPIICEDEPGHLRSSYKLINIIVDTLFSCPDETWSDKDIFQQLLFSGLCWVANDLSILVSCLSIFEKDIIIYLQFCWSEIFLSDCFRHPCFTWSESDSNV